MRFRLSCPPSQLDSMATVPSRSRRRTRHSRRNALAALALATAALVPTTSAVFITVPAGTAGQVIPTGGWTSGTFSASGKVNGTDSSICQPGSTTVTSSRATDKLGFSFIGTAIQVITTSGPQSGFYQATLDGTSSTVAIFSSQDSCGASFGAKDLPAGPHTIDVMLLQAGAVDVIAFRYDDGKIATSASSSGTARPSGTGTPPAPGESNTTAIIGGVVGGVLVGLALAALASWLFLRHRKRNYAAAADRDNHQLLAAPYGAPSIATTQGSGGGASGIGYGSGTYATQSTPSSRSNQNPNYYNNATSYYPSEAGWTGGPPGGYPTSNSTTSGGPRALHEEDLERIAAHVAAMVSPAVRASNYRSDDQDEYSGGGRSSLSYNGPEPTPTSSAPTQRTAKAEYIRSQQRPDAPGVTRAPDAREGSYPPSRNRKGGPQGPPEEPPPAY